MNDVDKLACDHWSYVQGILVAHQINFELIEAIKYHYKTAFVHGFKHAKETYDTNSTAN